MQPNLLSQSSQFEGQRPRVGQHQCSRRHHQCSPSHWESTGVKVQSRFNGSTFRCDTEGQRHTLHEQITFREIWIPISHAKHCKIHQICLNLSYVPVTSHIRWIRQCVIFLMLPDAPLRKHSCKCCKALRNKLKGSNGPLRPGSSNDPDDNKSEGRTYR